MLQYNSTVDAVGVAESARRGKRGDAGRRDPLEADAMTCEEYLARHSEYLDDELVPESSAEMHAHMAGCQRCARYDRVLRRGLDLLRDSEPILPSTDRYVGLHEHLLRSRGLVASGVGAPGGTTRAPIAATVAVAGVVALVAWSALFRATGVPASATAAVPQAAAPQPASASAPTAVADMDLVGRDAPVRAALWGGRALPRPTGLPVARPMLLAPGPYTPLRLAEPDHGQEPAVVSVLAPYSR